MMNNQRRLELSWSAQQPVSEQQADRQRRRRRDRLFVIGCSLLATVSLLLITAHLFIPWGAAAPLTPRERDEGLTTHLDSQAQYPILTQQETRSLPTALLASQIDRLLANKVAHQQFSGSVLIAKDGQVLLRKGYSMADWDGEVSNTAHTRFYLGSTTKQFTAMAILILQQQGKLHVSDHLCSHITPCPPAWQPVTIHELLTHSSGIPELDDSELSDDSPQAWIASYNNVSLVFTAGSQYSYCSICYQILGYTIQQVSGEPYIEFLQQAIFNPLQMRNTSCDPRYLSLPNSAVGYAGWQVTAVELAPPVDPQWSFICGSGLLQTTVEDLYRWDQGLYKHTLVSQQLLDEAFTPYFAAQYPGSSYGYGWFIAKSPTGHRLIWHDGRIDGFRTYIGQYLDDHVTIIFLSNLAALDELALASELEKVVFGGIGK